LSKHALNGGADLPFVEHDGLRIKDTPAISHMRIDPVRRCLATWVESRPPDSLTSLQTHHVGGGQIGPTPACRREAIGLCSPCSAQAQCGRRGHPSNACVGSRVLYAPSNNHWVPFPLACNVRGVANECETTAVGFVDSTDGLMTPERCGLAEIYDP
jgi:hypothetical protein